jgi:hypothetical protein
MMQGELTYYLGNGKTKRIHAGQIDVALKNNIHGCINEGSENAIFVSIYSPRDIGFQQHKSDIKYILNFFSRTYHILEYGITSLYTWTRGTVKMVF